MILLWSDIVSLGAAAVGIRTCLYVNMIYYVLMINTCIIGINTINCTM